MTTESHSFSGEVSNAASMFATKRTASLLRLQYDLETIHPLTPAIKAWAEKRASLIETTTECPRIADPNSECPLCGAIDNQFHHDRPRECAA